MTKTTAPIDTQERERRRKAVDFARASVALEGFHLDAESEALFARYIEGELDRDAMNVEVRRLAGLDPA